MKIAFLNRSQPIAECFGLIFRDDAAEFTNWKFGVSAYSQDRLISK